MKKKELILSENELQILNTMWEAKKPLSRAEILELTVDKTWKEKSIHILLNQLLDKGAIVIDGYPESGKNYGRTYSPTMTRGEYGAMRAKTTFNELKSDEDVIKEMVSSLVESKNVSVDILEELETIINNAKKEL